MDLISLHLMEKDHKHFMFDKSMCMPVIISKRAYNIIDAIKKGMDKEQVYKDYGMDIVNHVLNRFSEIVEKNNDPETNTQDYEKAFHTISGYANEKISFINLVLMVAQNCNISCRYCYGGESGSYNQKGLMSKQMAEKCFHYYLSNLGGNKKLNILFFGGEPLLNTDTIKHVIGLWEEYKHNYRDRTLTFSLVTNGILLTPELVRYFKEKEVRITVSLDGPEDIHNANRVYKNGKGTFTEVMSSIEILRSCHMPFSVKVTTNRYTQYDQLTDFLCRQDFDAVYISQVDYPMLCTEKDYQMDTAMYGIYAKWQQELMQKGCHDMKEGKNNTFQAKQFNMANNSLRHNMKGFPFKCVAGWHIASFGIDGRLYLCKSFVGQEAFCVGNADDGVDKEKLVRLYKDFLNASRDCDACWALSVCERGCYYEKSKQDGGFAPIPQVICNIYRDKYAAEMVNAAAFKYAKV